MGVVNVTADSFSDGGEFLDADDAVAHGSALASQGADVLDVGGESTRPGATPVPAEEEMARVVPVIERLSEGVAVPLSIDTTKASVARGALAAGASIVNDVSAGRFEPDILGVTADAGAWYVAMHMQGEPRTMQDAPHYDDVVDEVTAFLEERLDAARRAGIGEQRIMVDPGVGFGKTTEHNLALMANLDRLVERLGVPVLVGTSRKAFIGKILDLPVRDREEGTLATVVWAFEKGAAVVRVHNVAMAVRARRLLEVMRATTRDGVEIRGAA